MNHQVWVQTRTAIPPRFVTPELAEMRRKWYAQNPWKTDWDVVSEQQRSANLCLKGTQ